MEEKAVQYWDTEMFTTQLTSVLYPIFPLRPAYFVSCGMSLIFRANDGPTNLDTAENGRPPNDLKKKGSSQKEREESKQLRSTRRAYFTEKLNAEDTYNPKERDKALAKENKSHPEFAIDLEQCRPTPYLTISVSFYKRQLRTFHSTVDELASEEAICNVWDENISGRETAKKDEDPFSALNIRIRGKHTLPAELHLLHMDSLAISKKKKKDLNKWTQMQCKMNHNVVLSALELINNVRRPSCSAASRKRKEHEMLHRPMAAPPGPSCTYVNGKVV
ncbi:hypothetical protein PR048_023542 [Dryococelus australis]|uniref:Uncharacterized protein n=1 Tax=Dryococelus australis TaxID=614101 RepID=A0ABQ9GUG7_9NEOP|nr:hypothetical protein PR048_023542 [Dryococelus australis]